MISSSDNFATSVMIPFFVMAEYYSIVCSSRALSNPFRDRWTFGFISCLGCRELHCNKYERAGLCLIHPLHSFGVYARGAIAGSGSRQTGFFENCSPLFSVIAILICIATNNILALPLFSLLGSFRLLRYSSKQLYNSNWLFLHSARILLL